METLFLLLIIFFIYYLIISKKKNNFVVETNTEETEIQKKLSVLVKAIEMHIETETKTRLDKLTKIVDDEGKKILEGKEETEEETKIVKPKSLFYTEAPNKQMDVNYTFKVINNKVYYSNILEGCDSKNIIENIMNTNSFYSHIMRLISLLVEYSNKKNKTSFSLINLDRFKRTFNEFKTIYIIEIFLLDYKKYSSNKYSFTIEIIDNVINVKDISILNANLPIKRFTCEDTNHCSGKNSSLKIKDNISNLDGIAITNLEFDKYNGKEVSNKIDSKKILEFNDHILLDGETDSVFPCKKIKHTWDINGVSNSDKTQNNCYGSNYSIEKRNIQPYFHTSIFSNYNYGNINNNINDNFRWNNLLGHSQI